MTDRTSKIGVTILGATGSVGQRFVSLLADHPWFDVAAVCASERSTGRSYGEAVRWSLAGPVPERIARLPVLPPEPDSVREHLLESAHGSPALFDSPVESKARGLVFSALDAAVAGPIESDFASAGCFVVSNARSHRLDPEVPLVVPEVNPGHLDLVVDRPDGAGAIATNPNCSAIGLVLALKPLADRFGIARVQVTTLQAISGAGLPGVPALAIADNVIPFVAGEEEKLEREPRKILGRLAGRGIAEADIAISATCTRVPVSDGHTESVSVELARGARREELIEAWRSFRSEPQERGLPSAPEHPVHYLDAEDAPQPRLHRELERGMAAAVGRLRPCPVLGTGTGLGWKFVVLSHNTLRGAAGGAVLLAELAVARGLVRG